MKKRSEEEREADPVKQVLVIRKDLNMRKGKIAAQAAHASANIFLNQLKIDAGVAHLKPDDTLLEWLLFRRTKICVYVESEAELIAVYAAAKAASLPAELVRDAGLTEFKEPTLTAVAIGPSLASRIDLITGKLPLY